METQFCIVTIFNKLEQYVQMKQSFEEAGFTGDKCRYVCFDNSQSNRFEPFSTFNSVIPQCPEPYIIFCHQDVLVSPENGIGDLERALEELEVKDPAWSVVGNAGRSEDLALIIRITDPHTKNIKVGQFPHRVFSLDENFFILKNKVGLGFSSALSGFHLYAADLCLNALMKRRSVYVIDFHLLHLSGGEAGSEAFLSARDTFVRYWQHRFLFFYLSTPATSMFLSKFRPIRRFCKSRGGAWLFRKKAWLRIAIQRTALWLQKLAPTHRKSLG